MFLIKLDISSSVFSCLLIYFALFDELIRSSPQVAASANLVCCLHNCGEQILQRIVDWEDWENIAAYWAAGGR